MPKPNVILTVLLTATVSTDQATAPLPPPPPTHDQDAEDDSGAEGTAARNEHGTKVEEGEDLGKFKIITKTYYLIN